ncbi:MAG: nitrous oxide reductase family maturation protein NosD [Candidatus Hodarchaeota archaeon]
MLAKKIHFFLLVLLMILFSPSNSPNAHQAAHPNPIVPLKIVSEPATPFLDSSINYQNQSPIFIDGNANFSSTAAAEGWEGNGTVDDPYIIKGLQITGSVNSTLLEIQNTDIYFQILNCSFSGGDYGIYLENVTHGTIEQTKVTNAALYGIQLESSHNNTLTDNEVTDNKDGINLFLSDNNTLISNKITSNFGYGIHTFRSGWKIYPTFQINYGSFNTLINNSISHNGDDGLFLDHSWFSIVRKNTITKNGLNGISTLISSESLIANNTIINNGKHGIQIEQGESDVVKHNVVANNTGYGVRFLGEGLLNRVEWNDFLGNNPSGSSQVWDDYNFNNTYAHNYWADWTEPDRNADGIVDKSYPIEVRTRTIPAFNEDPTPLVDPFHLTPITLKLLNGVGKILPDLIPIQWAAVNDSLGHAIVYAIFYSANGGKNWFSIASDTTTTSYDWNTTAAVDGSNYLVKVVATCSAGFATTAISDPILENQEDDSIPGFLVIETATVLILLGIGAVVGVCKWRHKRI